MSDWLVTDDDDEGQCFRCTGEKELVADQDADEKRCYELVRIRQIYIPELVMRLHSLLVSSRAFIPRYVLFFCTFFFRPRPWSITCFFSKVT